MRLFASLLIISLFATSNRAVAAPVEVKIEVGGAMLEHGGVVILYSIPVPAGSLSQLAGNVPTHIRLDSRYVEVQFKFVKEDDYVVRLRNAIDSSENGKLATEALSIIGTDMEDHGPKMKIGFVDAYSNGGQIIRVLPKAEYAGIDETTRSMARWGETQGNDAVPPADRRSARALEWVVKESAQRASLQCSGDERVQTCTVPEDQWPRIEARWWRAIAESRLERLHYYALRRCYDSTWLGGGTCKRNPNTDEPEYIHNK